MHLYTQPTYNSITISMTLLSLHFIAELGRITPGFVGSDLKTLTREAGMLAVSRIVQHSPEVMSGNDVSLTSRHTVIESAVDKGVREAHIRVDNVSEGSLERMPLSADTLDHQIGSERMRVIADDAEMVVDLTNDDIKEDTNAQTPSQTSLSALDQMVVTCDSQPTEHSQAAREEVTVSVAVGMCDFICAAKSVQPTAKREGFAVVPDVTWGESYALYIHLFLSCYLLFICVYYLYQDETYWN